EGAIFPKRSKPQGGRNSTPHDTGTSMEDQLVTMNIQGGGRFPHRGTGGTFHAEAARMRPPLSILCRTGPPKVVWGPVRAKTNHASFERTDKRAGMSGLRYSEGRACRWPVSASCTSGRKGAEGRPEGPERQA